MHGLPSSLSSLRRPRLGPGLTGAREDGGRDGRTDGESGGRRRPGGRRRRCRGPATSQCGRAAGAAPRAPQRARAGGDTRGGGTLSSGTQPPGRTDSDRPPASRPSPRPSAAAAFPWCPRPANLLLLLTSRVHLRRLGSSPQALSPPPLPLLAPSSHFLPRLPSGFAASPAPPPARPPRALSSLEMKSSLTAIHESTAATSLVPKPFQGSSIKPGNDTRRKRKVEHGPGKTVVSEKCFGQSAVPWHRVVINPQPSPLPSLAHPERLSQGCKGAGLGDFYPECFVLLGGWR